MPDSDAASSASTAPLTHDYESVVAAEPARAVDALLRALDLAIAAAILLLLSPILALIGLAILVTSGTPVLYKGARVGRGGGVFQMYKFRTLAPGAEDRLGPYYGAELTRRTAEEVTLVGRALRAVHLDEVPQLWNVIKGDMSMVGPRPIRPAFFTELTEEIPQYWQRLAVRPGVTGFAQMRVTREDAWAYKLAHDMEYIADRSIGLYFAVLFATLRRVLGSRQPWSGSAPPP